MTISSSKLSYGVAQVLVREGYLASAEELSDGCKKSVKVLIKYDNKGMPVIRKIKRISKSSCRISKKVVELHGMRQKNFGTFVLSTSKGVLSDFEAIEKNVSGEILCEVS